MHALNIKLAAIAAKDFQPLAGNDNLVKFGENKA
jgi:hypothetical protein